MTCGELLENLVFSATFPLVRQGRPVLREVAAAHGWAFDGLDKRYSTKGLALAIDRLQAQAVQEKLERARQEQPFARYGSRRTWAVA